VVKPANKLDAEICAYRGRYGVTFQYFCDLLGRDGKPLYKDTFIAKRKGERELTIRECKVLADLFGMTLDELYETLPPINRQ